MWLVQPVVGTVEIKGDVLSQMANHDLNVGETVENSCEAKMKNMVS